MANVINRSTKKYLKSVNTPEYPIEDWIINPDMPGCDVNDIIINGDIVREMTQEEKNIRDYVEPVPEPTLEELILIVEEERLENIKIEIAKTYSISDEIELIRETLVYLLPEDQTIKVWNDVILAAKDKFTP